MINLKSIYYSKQEFISDFLVYCKETRNKFFDYEGKYFRNKFIAIEGELWTFGIYVQFGKLYLQSSLYINGQFIRYPKEQWDNLYKDTSYEDSLKTFLNREIKKGV